MTPLLALLTMNEQDYFPEIYDECIKYFYGDYVSQGLRKWSWKLLFYENFNQLIKTDSEKDGCWSLRDMKWASWHVLRHLQEDCIKLLYFLITPGNNTKGIKHYRTFSSLLKRNRSRSSILKNSASHIF